jgi:hypothetical protein
MIPTRGRGGGHDWIGVDALLWVDHVEIRLLLSRIKAVWGAMRHVRVVVAIVMVHEVQRDELSSPVRRIYKKEKGEESRKKKKRGKKRQKEKRRGNGHRLESKEEMRSDSILEQHDPLRPSKRRRMCVFIFILFLTVNVAQRDDPREWQFVNEG